VTARQFTLSCGHVLDYHQRETETFHNATLLCS